MRFAKPDVHSEENDVMTPEEEAAIRKLLKTLFKSY